MNHCCVKGYMFWKGTCFTVPPSVSLCDYLKKAVKSEETSSLFIQDSHVEEVK